MTRAKVEQKVADLTALIAEAEANRKAALVAGHSTREFHEQIQRYTRKLERQERKLRTFDLEAAGL